MAEVKQKSIKKNFIMNAILTMSGFIFPLISFPYIAEVLGPSGTGRVKFATSIVAYFSMFAQLGIPTYGIRVCAKVRDNKEELSKTVHELLFINLLMSAVAYALFFASLFVVPKFRSNKLLLVIISLTIFFNAIGIEYLYRALEYYTYITVRSVVFKIIGILSMFFLVKSESDFVVYGAITIFAGSASNILNFINSRKLINYKWYGKYALKKHYKAIIVFFAMSCATTIYLNLDGIMLGFMTTDADVGYYDAAVKIKTILVSVVTSLGTVLLPRASYYVENGEFDEFKRITDKALNFVLILATPLMIYFIIFAREGVLFLSGEKFVPSIFAMQIIMPTILFIGVTNIMGIQILVPLGLEKIVLYSEIAGAIIDLIINALLIPYMKSAGAALGTTIAELVVFVVQYHFLVYIFKSNSKTKKNNSKIKEIDINIRESYAKISYWKIAVGVTVATLVSLLIKIVDVSVITKSIRLQSFISLGASSILFFGVYLLVMLLPQDSLTKEIMDSVIKKIKK